MANNTVYANNAAGTLAANIGPSDTIVLLGAGQGAAFPTPTGGDWFYVTVVHFTTGLIEVMKCTARAADSLTVQRGRDSTTAISFNIGSVIEMRLCAIMMREVDYRTVKGVANGLATLDASTLIPVAQIPASIARAADFIPLTQKAANNGVASLDGSGDVPDGQISALIARVSALAAYIPLTQKAAASGVATLDAGTKIPTAQIPDLSASYLTKNNPSATGTLTIVNVSASGSVTAAGNVTSTASLVTSLAVVSTTGNIVVAPTGAGNVLLRPNGSGSVTNQATYNAAGLLTVVNLSATSDKRKKKFIRKETAHAALADKLVLKSWQMRSDGTPGRGLVAQDLLPHAPEYVHEQNGVLSVDKAGVALEAIIDLASRVRKLEKVKNGSANNRARARVSQPRYAQR